MKHHLLTMLLALLLVLLCGCTDNREKAVSELEQFTEHLQLSSSNFTEDDWTTAKGQFEEIVEELKLYEYTDDELKHIGQLKGKCIGIFSRSAANDLKRKMHRIYKEAEGFITGFSGQDGD